MKILSSFNRLLAVFFVFIGMLITFRILYTGSLVHLFICWNIFLAWIPYMLSNFFAEVKQKAKWKQLFLFASWLLFFPNALYIVTDLIHIDDNQEIPVWYDAVLLFASSFIGIMMAFVSLQKVEFFLKCVFSKRVVAALVPLILFVASFGVYLGRFERWNSWDVLTEPRRLLNDILELLMNPLSNVSTYGFTLLLTAFLLLDYLTLQFFQGQKSS